VLGGSCQRVSGEVVALVRPGPRSRQQARSDVADPARGAASLESDGPTAGCVERKAHRAGDEPEVAGRRGLDASAGAGKACGQQAVVDEAQRVEVDHVEEQRHAAERA
jgi:hypothetical protein